MGAPPPPLPDWLARRLPFDRRLVQADGCAVHVMEGGPAGAPAVVFVHGNPTWGFLWRDVAAPVAAAGLRVVLPDLVGLGLSEKPRDPAFHTLDRHARVLGALLDAVAPGPVILALHDWGGPIGLAAMAERPGRLAGLVVTNSVLGPPREGHRPTTFHRFANLPVLSTAAFRLLGFPQNVLAFTQADRRSISGEVARAYRWPLRHLADRTAPLALARMVPTGGPHPSLPGLRAAHAVATGFAGPSAIVWGDEDPVIGRALRRVRQTLPRATVARIAAGHYPQEEDPRAIAAAVLDVARRAGLR